ncbi:unnamed protein product [Caenorhabditis nigoni]
MLQFLILSLMLVALGEPSRHHLFCQKEKEGIQFCRLETKPARAKFFPPPDVLMEMEESMKKLDDCVGELNCPKNRHEFEAEKAQIKLIIEIGKQQPCLDEKSYRKIKDDCDDHLFGCRVKGFIQCFVEKLRSRKECDESDIEKFEDLTDLYQAVCDNKMKTSRNHKDF